MFPAFHVAAEIPFIGFVRPDAQLLVHVYLVNTNFGQNTGRYSLEWSSGALEIFGADLEVLHIILSSEVFCTFLADLPANYYTSAPGLTCFL